MFDDPKSTLDALRWKADMKVINYFGGYVWLKPLIVKRKRIGITDCCFVSNPCQRHKIIEETIVKISNN